MKHAPQALTDGKPLQRDTPASPHRIIGVIAVCGLLLVACSEESDSPEQQLRALFQEVAAAAEARDIAQLRAFVADEYADNQGRNKRAIAGLLRFYLLRHQNVHVFTQVKTLGFPEPFRAEAVVLVATAGTPIGDVAELQRLRADLHRFEVEAVRQGRDDWKVTRVEWRRAELVDFL